MKHLLLPILALTLLAVLVVWINRCPALQEGIA